MRTTACFSIAAGAALLVALAGCDRDKPLDGIGDLRFGTSTLKDWGYPCNPPENGKTFCQNNPLERAHHVSLGGQDAYAGALFAGTEDDAPLEEIELHVGGCRADSLRSWLIDKFGEPSGQSEGAVYWKKKILFISAKVPPKGIECKVNFVEVKNKDRIAALKKRE